MTRDKAYRRFSWSHELAAHRQAVRLYNGLMRFVPFRIKYGIGKRLRAQSLPYSIIGDDWVVVQVGAPRDTLHAGRSRGLYFALFAGPKGTVLIIEPDVDSIREFASVAKKQGIRGLILCPTAAWSEKQTLEIHVSDSHPASTFTAGTKEYDEKRLQSFRTIEVPATTIDSLLADNGLHKAELVSITTNGAEREILQGMGRTIAAGLPYISMARTGVGYVEMMADYGYGLYSHDDRGYTFKREGSV